MKRLSRRIGTIAALYFLMPMLAGCGPSVIHSASSLAAPTAISICATARAGLVATPAKARAASMQCLIATETAYQSAAFLVLPFVANGTIKGKAVDRIRELNTAIVSNLSAAYNARSYDERLQLADAIAIATAEILRIIAERSE